MTVSIENFIKAVYKQSNQLSADTKLSTIARRLDISNAAATDMAKKLAVKKLVNYTKYKPLTLTDSGKKLALKVIRKHRLWETFLHETLNLSLHEIHNEAEHLEHISSDFLTNKIDEYLGYPAVDPHGDPIPTDVGKIEFADSQLLSEAQPGNNYKVSRLNSSEKEFFDFCSANHITIGSDISVEKQFDSSKMTEINIKGNKIVLNEIFTNFIFVEHTAKSLVS